MLDKAIYYGKEKREPYHIPARQNNMFCRCDFYHHGQHGYDPRVTEGRLHKEKNRNFASRDALKDEGLEGKGRKRNRGGRFR